MGFVKIAGKRWHDVGSDINWIDYGGAWARPAGPDEPGLWFAFRFDEEDEDGTFTACCTLFEVRPDEVSDYALCYAGVPTDGLDEYGTPIPAAHLAAQRVAAAVSYGEGVVARVSATSFGPEAAIRLRIAAASFLLGDVVVPGPFQFSGC